MAGTALENRRTPIKIQLALTWASLMFLYIYNDYFSLYTPGTIASISAGRMGPLGLATQGVMIGVSLLLAVPALMIFLSAALPATASKQLNVLLGLAYTAVELLTLQSSYLFYQIVVGLEVVMALLIVWLALRWPPQV